MISKKFLLSILIFVSTPLAWGSAGCGGKNNNNFDGGDSSASGDTDGDTDADTDGDTDADTDGDTDADTDGDTDADTDGDADGDTDAKYIADHTIAKESVLRSIPVAAINAAKDNLHILYCGTSHSQQVMEGMKGLEQYKSGDDTLFAFTHNGVPVSGMLDIHYRGADGTDLSHDTVDTNGHIGYFLGTIAYLDNPANADVNVVMWSWCSIEGHVVQIYIDNFDELIDMYRAGGSKGRTASNAVEFVFMSGYARGSDGDNPSAANSPYNNAMAIRSYCETNHHFMLDYWSHDVYDYGTDAYNPYESGNENAQHAAYCDSHTLGEDWFECRHWANGNVKYPAHTTQHLTGNRRAYAAWWIWARLAGWGG